MDSEKGFSNLHFVVAAVFALTVALGSFAGTMALTQMSDNAMSDVTGQEGIVIDQHLGGSFQVNAIYWTDGDGATTAGSNTGTVGIHGISASSGSLDLTGMTIDTDGSVSVGGTTTGAIVIGLPDIPTGLHIEDIDPGNGSPTTFPASSSASIGSIDIGGITAGNARLEVAAN